MVQSRKGGPLAASSQRNASKSWRRKSLIILSILVISVVGPSYFLTKRTSSDSACKSCIPPLFHELFDSLMYSAMLTQFVKLSLNMSKWTIIEHIRVQNFHSLFACNGINYFHLWSMLGGSVRIWMKNNLFSSLRAKFILAPLGLPTWIWLSKLI